MLSGGWVGLRSGVSGNSQASKLVSALTRDLVHIDGAVCELVHVQEAVCELVDVKEAVGRAGAFEGGCG